MALLFCSAAFFLLLAGSLEAQEEPDIRSLLVLVNKGNEQLLRTKLPQLLEQHPRHAGLLYVKALITADGDEAVGYYQTVVAESPDSEWADDALYRLYQYYYSLGAYNVAAQQLAELKRKYPKSPHLKTISATIEKDSKESDAKQSFAYSVQVGAFSQSAAAQVKLRDMKALGYSCELRTKMVGGKETKESKVLYTVLVGNFPSFDLATAFAKKMTQRHNMDAIVVRK